MTAQINRPAPHAQTHLPKDAADITEADDLQHAVHDKREGWRANPTKARRHQRRYTGLLTRELLKRGTGVGDEEGFDEEE